MEDEAPVAHARNSPSGAGAWMRCEGMLNFIDDSGFEDEGGYPADVGSVMHSFCESALRENREAYHYVGETRTYGQATVTLEDEDADKMQAGLDFIDTIDGKLVIETRVDLQKWLGPDQFGTLDVGLCNKWEIVIFDWKWGYLPVSPVENYQLMLYALGFYYQVAIHLTKATTFRLVIWQPNAPGGGGEWVIELDDLLEFGRRAKRIAKRTRDPNAKRTPGPIQCAYCPGAKTLTCEEYGDYNLAMVVEDFDEMDDNIEHGFPMKLSPKGITPERRSYIIEHRAMINKFLDRLQADEHDDYMKGLPTPGRKAVLGNRGKREWSDEDKARQQLTSLLDDDAFTKKLLSPTQAQKELSPTMYESLVKKGLVYRGEPKATMVPIEDDRPALPTLLDDFTDD